MFVLVLMFNSNSHIYRNLVKYVSECLLHTALFQYDRLTLYIFWESEVYIRAPTVVLEKLCEYRIDPLLNQVKKLKLCFVLHVNETLNGRWELVSDAYSTVCTFWLVNFIRFLRVRGLYQCTNCSQTASVSTSEEFSQFNDIKFLSLVWGAQLSNQKGIFLYYSILYYNMSARP